MIVIWHCVSLIRWVMLWWCRCIFERSLKSWLVSSHMPEPAPLTEQLCYIHSYKPSYSSGINDANVFFHGEVAWCHRNRGGTTDEALEEQCVLWERGTSAGLSPLKTWTVFYLGHKVVMNVINPPHKSAVFLFWCARKMVFTAVFVFLGLALEVMTSNASWCFCSFWSRNWFLQSKKFIYIFILHFFKQSSFRY